MDDQISEIEKLERIFIDENANPVKISYGAIKHITKNFAQEIGTGGSAVVYLGDLNNRMISVKKFQISQSIEKVFMQELSVLVTAKHKNIVRFLGYCADTQGELVQVEGKLVMADVICRFLCFEFLPNGNLDQYHRDKTHRSNDWNKIYKIIRGICEGLQYLHQKHICHLDLKPANVLLGPHFEPKITDFGNSRIFGETQSREFTKNLIGTWGYIAPELEVEGEISLKADIYSLGVLLLAILIKEKNPSAFENSGHTVDELFIFEHEESLESVAMENPQIRICIAIANSCVVNDPDERPTIDEIIQKMNESETLDEGYAPITIKPINDPNSTYYQEVVQSFMELPFKTPSRSSFKKTPSKSDSEEQEKRFDDIYLDLDDLESVLQGRKKPGKLSYQLLQFITGKFSDKRIIGKGGFSKIYKGIGTVAVKRLTWPHSSDELKFRQEVKSTTMAQHRNVVRFLGHCSYTEEKEVEYEGKIVSASVLEKLLCFEYMSSGSLSDYLSDASRRVEWRERYRIIKGICEGLHYLHGKKIIHLDLKPDNILLDANMEPKIADFGLARCFGISQNQTSIGGTFGYMAPETLNQRISFKSDIYSIGVVISEILTGMNYCSVENIRTPFFVENALEIWRTILEGLTTDNLLDQVRVCAEISIACLDTEPSNRPDIQRIMEILVEKECRDNFIKSGISVITVAQQSETVCNELQKYSQNVPGDNNSENEDDEGDGGLLRTDSHLTTAFYAKSSALKASRLHVDKSGSCENNLRSVRYGLMACAVAVIGVTAMVYLKRLNK